MSHKPDRLFFFIVIALAIVGFFLFASASLGLLGKPGASVNAVAFKQFVVLVFGFFLFMVTATIDYRFWRKWSPWIFGLGIILSLLIFIPGIGKESGGAKRWILINGFSFQPSDLLRFGFILYLASLLAKARGDIGSTRKGLLPFLILSAIVGVLMVLQPDIDTLVIMLTGGLAMFFVAGARWSHLAIICLIALIGIASIAAYKPYIRARLMTYIDRTQNTQGAGWQINQSLIAIGSGGLTGRGFGQSIQKFKYLPEPIGDSVFSVASEEFGFIGSTIIILAFLLFALAGLRIATRAPNGFGRLAAVGIVIMIMTGTFINLCSMLGLIPLTGTPLLFISHGGTALLFALVEAGIILSISRHQQAAKPQTI
jgi:cell division protein FtsW